MNLAMQQPGRPLPIDMRVRDIDHRDRLSMKCPTCGQAVGRQGYDLHLELRPDMLLIRYVARHFCAECSRKAGAKIRPTGWIEPYPRSGAESGHETQSAR
jgi:ribosomal protein L37AE/L43A